MGKFKEKYKLDKEELRKLYWEDGLSLSQVAKKVGANYSVLQRRFKKYNIPVRTLSDSHKGRRKGERNNAWKGGEFKNSQGYIEVSLGGLPDEDLRLTRGRKKTILKHHLVMSKQLGRSLESYEMVHHKNGIRDDNRIENLELLHYTAHHPGRDIIIPYLKILGDFI